jgi:lipoprotein-releasing system permease protein
MMFSFFIARRYLFARKRHHTTAVITAVSVCGVVLATAALTVTLSVFNGFSDMVASFFTAFDPQLKVLPAAGKTLPADDARLAELRALDCIEVYTEVLEEQALIVGNERQWVVTVKGVSDNFEELTDINSILYGDGEFVLHADVLEYGVMGIRLASALGLNTHYDGGLPIYAPRHGERVNMSNPLQSFRHEELLSPGVVFAVNQGKYDTGYILTSLSFARRLFDRQGQVSAVELRLKADADLRSAKAEIRRVLGDGFDVKDRYEQQEDTFRIMQVEKFIAYLFLTFILLVASFNMIGSLAMLMIEKQENVATLRALGANDGQISRIFLLEGWLISGLGATLGILGGLALCWAQMHFGLIRLGRSEGSFVVDAYPVSIHSADVLLTFLTVLAVGLVAVWLPVRRMTRNL